MTAERVLFIRVNSGVELFNTRESLDAVRAHFPGARLAALATPQTETLAALRADDRLDVVVLFPPEGADPAAKSPRAFRRFVAAQGFDVTVVCFGNTPGTDYSRHLLSALACPGRRFLLDAQGRLFPLLSLRAARVLLSAALVVAGRGLALPVLRALTVRARCRRPGPDLGDLLARGLIRRVLWIRLDHIGDIVMSLPAMWALKDRCPALQMDALVLPESAGVLADQPFLDHVMTYAAPHLSRRGARAGVGTTLALLRRLRRRYDLVIDLRGDDVARSLAWLSGAPLRLGPERGPYETPGRVNASFLMTHTVARPDDVRHTVEDNLHLLGPLGGAAGTPYRLPITEERLARVGARLRERGVPSRFAAIHARSGQPIKDWRPERFAAVADHLVRRHDLDVLLTGGPDDHAYLDGILRGIGARARVHDGAGLFPLEELPALLARAEVLVTVDTGPMHIAAAVGTPIVALLLDWYAAKFHPFGQADAVLVPTLPDMGGDHTPLGGISVGMVTAAVDRALCVGGTK